MRLPPDVPQPSALKATQGAFAMLSQVLLHGGEIDSAAWLELSPFEQHLALGVVLGATAGVVNQLRVADTQFDTAQWLSSLAVQVTAAVSL